MISMYYNIGHKPLGCLMITPSTSLWILGFKTTLVPLATLVSIDRDFACFVLTVFSSVPLSRAFLSFLGDVDSGLVFKFFLSSRRSLTLFLVLSFLTGLSTFVLTTFSVVLDLVLEFDREQE